MGTTSDKLTYLNTTKQKLKDSINALGGDITSETTFRNYATELDTIYDNLPKTTGEGSNLSLTTLKGRINVDDIKGDTQQDTYEGYNLFTTNGNVDGVTIGITKKSISESEILFNGTTSQAENIIYKNDVFTLPSGTYTMKVEVDTSKFTKPQGTDMAIYLRNTSGNATIYETTLNLLINNSGTYIKTFTLSADTNIRFQVYTNKAGIVFNNASFKFTLVSGSETKPYEQYVGGTASPNPTYPQDINVVTGTQEVVVQNKNIYDSSYRTPDNTILCAGGTCTEENGVFTIQATRNDMYVWNVQSNGSTYSAYQNQLIDFIENPYTITITNSLFTKNFITFYDADKKVLNFKQFNTNIFTFTKGQDYSVPSEAKYFSLRFGINDSVSGTTYTTSVQIELGSTATPYTPHQEQTKTLHLGDIELAKIGTYQDRIFETSGKNKCNITSTEGWVYSAGLPNNRDNSIITDNFDSNSIQYHSNTNAYLEVLTNQIQLKPNTQYTITFSRTSTATNNQFFIYNYASGYSINFRDNNQNVFEKTFTTDSNGIIVLGFGFGNVAGTAKVSNIMIVEGSTALPYEPYGSDKWYIEKNIGKTLLKDIPQASNTWTKSNAYSTNDYFCGFCGFASIKINSYYILCNKLINAIYTDTTTSECIANDSESVNLKIKASRLSENSPAGLANYLANEGSDIYILYILKKPTYTEITNTTLIEELNEIEKMMSYNGTTNISVSGNLPMLVSVSALKGESE